MKLIAVSSVGFALFSLYCSMSFAGDSLEASFFCKSRPEEEAYYVDFDAEKTCGNSREVVKTFYGVCHQRVQCAYLTEAVKKAVIEMAMDEMFVQEFQKQPAEVPDLHKEFRKRQLASPDVSFNRLTPFSKDKYLAKIGDGANTAATEVNWQRGVVTCRALKVNDQTKCPPPDVCKNDLDFRSRNTATIRAAEFDSAMAKMPRSMTQPQMPTNAPATSAQTPSTAAPAATGIPGNDAAKGAH